MNFKELIAGMLSLLVTGATFAFAVSAATTLDTYPGFLKSAGQLSAYVVVGSGGTDPAGLASDIAGAVDIAVRLAEVQYAPTTVSGGTTTTAGFSGLERDIQVQSPVTVNDSNSGFPGSLQSYHFSGLKRGTVTFNGQQYNYHEEVDVGSGVLVEHNASVNNVNGTETLVVPSGGFTNGGISYRFVFDQAISGLGSTATPNYTYTLTVPVAGTNMVITGVDTAGFSALAGNVGVADSKTPITYSGYSVYVLDGSSGSWAKIQIKDASGNIVQTDILNLNQQNTYTFGSTTFQVRVINVYASTVTSTASAQIAVGSNVAVTYPAGESVDPKYQVDSQPWYIHAPTGGYSTAGTLAAGSYIAVSYDSQNTSYFKTGTYLTGPNNYFSFGVGGILPVSWATITVTPVSAGQTVYASSSATTSLANGLSGFKVHSDTAGTIYPAATAGTFSPYSWQDAYLLFNTTNTGGGLNGSATYAFIGHYDTAASKIVVDYNISAALPQQAAFKLQYGGSGTGVYYLNFTLVNSTTNALNGALLYAASGPTKTGSATYVNYTFVQDSGVTWGTSVVPTFHLGTNKGSADTGDLVMIYEGNYPAGQVSQDLLTDGQMIVKAPNSNDAADTAVFQIPADLVKDKYLFGTFGGTTTTTTTSGTVYSFTGPITSPVAYLDTDMTTEKKAAKDLVVVGGPCINSVAADVLGLTYPACGAASGITANTAMIKEVDNKYASGQNIVLVAGWSASDTRLAADVLQNYDQATVSGKLVGKSSVTVSGTSVATATIA